MDTDQIIDMCMSAKTLEQIDHAKQTLRAWIREHPEDDWLLDCGETLEMSRQALLIDRREPVAEARTWRVNRY